LFVSKRFVSVYIHIYGARGLSKIPEIRDIS